MLSFRNIPLRPWYQPLNRETYSSIDKSDHLLHAQNYDETPLSNGPFVKPGTISPAVVGALSSHDLGVDMHHEDAGHFPALYQSDASHGQRIDYNAGIVEN